MEAVAERRAVKLDVQFPASVSSVATAAPDAYQGTRRAVVPVSEALWGKALVPAILLTHPPTAAASCPRRRDVIPALDEASASRAAGVLRDGSIDPHAAESDAVIARFGAECVAADISLRIAVLASALNMQAQRGHRINMITEIPMPERQEHAIVLQREIAALPPGAALHQSLFIPHGHAVDLLVKIAELDAHFAADARTVSGATAWPRRSKCGASSPTTSWRSGAVPWCRRPTLAIGQDLGLGWDEG